MHCNLMFPCYTVSDMDGKVLMETLSHTISKYLVGMLEQNQECSEEKHLLLVYGTEVILENLWKTIAYILWGIMIHRGLEMLLAMLVFCSIRKYAGGYHAKTPIGCFLCGFIGLNIVICIPMVFRPHQLCFSVCCVLVMFLYSLFSLNKPKKIQKNIFFLLLCLFLFSFCVPRYWGTIILFSSIFEMLTLLKTI